MTQLFKGDPTEIKMEAVVSPLTDIIGASLDEFYVNGFNASPFLLMLYDQNRMPFSKRVSRTAFVAFVKEALANFHVIGTFESYIFVLTSIFGTSSEFLFSVPAPGKLTIDVLAITNSEFDFIAREFIDGTFQFFEMVDYNSDILTFRGVPGIDTEYALNLLFSEIMPAGITPTISLNFFTKSNFIGYDSLDVFEMTDNLNNQIIFVEF